MIGTQNKKGYQGAEKSGVEITIYQQDKDPLLLDDRKTIKFDGRHIDDNAPAVVSVSTSKQMGAPSGSWNMLVKPTTKTIAALESIVDDDWIDIVFTRNSKKHHVMRGLVDGIRETKVVSGSGATSTAYQIYGRDFGKVFEQTPIWFNVHNTENVAGSVSMKIFSTRALRGAVNETVRGYIYGFLEELQRYGRANWVLPKAMPLYGGPDISEVTGNKFIKNLYYDDNDFVDDPERQAIDPNFLMPSGNVWTLAQEYSDPTFCELFCDLRDPKKGYPDQDAELTTKNSVMQLVLRDRPFPTVDQDLQSPYFNLPEYVIPLEYIHSRDTGRGGHERYNAFFVTSQLTQENQMFSFELIAPLWDKEDILVHGLRRFDITTNYVAKNSDLLTMTETQRAKVRDWYAINPYLTSGTIALNRGMPEVRIGAKARIYGFKGAWSDLSYYIEGVDHSWQYGMGMRTNLTVTRGWKGTDNSYLNAIGQLARRYTSPAKAEPGA